MENNLNKIKTIIKNLMDDMLQKDVPCNYIITCGKNEWHLKDVLATDAYLKTYEMSIGQKKTSCYMCPLGVKAASAVFEVDGDNLYLSGQNISISKEVEKLPILEINKDKPYDCSFNGEKLTKTDLAALQSYDMACWLAEYVGESVEIGYKIQEYMSANECDEETAIEAVLKEEAIEMQKRKRKEN